LTSADDRSTSNPAWIQDLKTNFQGGTAYDAIQAILQSIDEEDLQSSFLNQLRAILPTFPRLERGLEPLRRFLANTRAPSSFLSFLDRDRDALPTLLEILSMNTSATEWLIDDPDSFDWLRLSAGQAVDADHLKDTLLHELEHLDDEHQVLASLSRFRKRETLRVLCAVELHEMPLGVASQQLSWIADAGISGALRAAKLERLRDRRNRQNGQALSAIHDQLLILGIGALGGQELQLNDSLELVLLADLDAFSDVWESAWDELQRSVTRALEWIESPDGLGYSVSFPLNALNHQSTNSILIEDERKWLQFLENQGRTWVRLALMKCRYIAGSPHVARRIIEELPTIIYRRYLSRADIAGIEAVNRKIDREWKELEPSESGAIRLATVLRWKHEIESFVQFMQLVYGGELEEIRFGNTTQGIDALAQQGCLTEQERSLLQQAYDRFAMAIFGHQAVLREQSDSNRFDSKATRPESELAEAWERVKQIRDHFKSAVFVDGEHVGEETDLILDPQPNLDWIRSLLAKHGFRKPDEAYQNLRELSEEEVRMLSTQRCRHFLSMIAPKLLGKISQTPDPDLTLENLAISCRSLGGKGVLWELFSVHEPSLDLYIRLCGASPYLIGILTSNPGMIDELLDSLMLNRLPNNQQLGFMLHELCRGAQDIEPIVHSFKNARHLNVGARDILGKESIADTHRALSDIAEVCFQQLVDAQYGQLAKRFGVPVDKAGEVCKFSVVALGKLGGREPNYHSDITLLFLYDQPGVTRPLGATRHHEPISAEYFFHQLAQKVAQTANRVSRSGRLFETRNWIVSPDRNATLAWQLDEFQSFLEYAPNLAHSRQQLCNARCFVGEATFQQSVHQSFRHILIQRKWSQVDDAAVLQQRLELESTASAGNLKRGFGGTLDIETIAQVLVLRHVDRYPQVLLPGTLDQLEHLRSVALIGDEDANQLILSYNFLRGVESGIRLMNTAARHDLPDSEHELSRLAYVLQLSSGSELQQKCAALRSANRELYQKYLHDGVGTPQSG
jgi:glutamate-ammonia-ligase adenylyltransferase